VPGPRFSFGSWPTPAWPRSTGHAGDAQNSRLLSQCKTRASGDGRSFRVYTSVAGPPAIVADANTGVAGGAGTSTPYPHAGPPVSSSEPPEPSAAPSAAIGPDAKHHQEVIEPFDPRWLRIQTATPWTDFLVPLSSLHDEPLSSRPEGGTRIGLPPRGVGVEDFFGGQ